MSNYKNCYTRLECLFFLYVFLTVVVDVVCFIVKMTVLNILLPCHFDAIPM